MSGSSSLSLSQSGFTSAHLVCNTRATERRSKTFARISGQMTEENACMAFGLVIAEGPVTCGVF